MVVVDDRVAHNLLGLPVAQVYNRHAPVQLVADKQELPIILPVGLAKRRVVRISRRIRTAPVDLVDCRILYAKPVATPRIRHKHWDYLENAHRGDTNRYDLSAMSRRSEHYILVVLAAGHIGRQRGIDILRGKPTLVCNRQCVTR
jgi:hypothetical protein